MTFVYTVGPRYRLVLGPAKAPHRLCIPIPADLYARCSTLTPDEQHAFLTRCHEALRHTLETLQQGEPTAEEEVPDGL